ncbi:MAG: hypothetical protein ACO3VI_11085 [Ilumatobacteraceae bacterium]
MPSLRSDQIAGDCQVPSISVRAVGLGTATRDLQFGRLPLSQDLPGCSDAVSGCSVSLSVTASMSGCGVAVLVSGQLGLLPGLLQELPLAVFVLVGVVVVVAMFVLGVVVVVQFGLRELADVLQAFPGDSVSLSVVASPVLGSWPSVDVPS